VDINSEVAIQLTDSVLKNLSRIRELEGKIEPLASRLRTAENTKERDELKLQLLSELIPLLVECAARKGKREVTILSNVEHIAGALKSVVSSRKWHEDEERLSEFDRKVFHFCKEMSLKPRVQYWTYYDPCKPDYGWELVVRW
jgi:hypothetical protein